MRHDETFLVNPRPCPEDLALNLNPDGCSQVEKAVEIFETMRAEGCQMNTVPRAYRVSASLQADLLCLGLSLFH